jgi:hypothetical protein
VKTPEAILSYWIQLVNSGDVDKLISLYGLNAALIPTFSNRILDTPQKIRAYFEKLASRENLNVTLHPKTIHTQKITESVYSVCGVYLWQFTVDEELLNFEARFTFVIAADSENPIIHHHSSQIPRTL